MQQLTHTTMPTLHILATIPQALPKGVKLTKDAEVDVEDRLKDGVEEFRVHPVSATLSAMRIAEEVFSVTIPQSCFVTAEIKIGDEIITLARGHRDYYAVNPA